MRPYYLYLDERLFYTSYKKKNGGISFVLYVWGWLNFLIDFTFKAIILQGTKATKEYFIW